jgi:hypothetical protein
MRRKKIRPALVLCSPSLRTRQTLEPIEPSLGEGSSIELEPQLYATSEAKLLELLQALPESVDSVMLARRRLQTAECPDTATNPEIRMPQSQLQSLLGRPQSRNWCVLVPFDSQLPAEPSRRT